MSTEPCIYRRMLDSAMAIVHGITQRMDVIKIQVGLVILLTFNVCHDDLSDQVCIFLGFSMYLKNCLTNLSD